MIYYNYLSQSDHLLYIVVLIGLMVGSFLNVLIYRLPLIIHKQWEIKVINGFYFGQIVDKKFDLCFPSSHCINCTNPIRWYDNIPVLSYILLAGHCRRCRAYISFRYPFVELLSTVLSVFACLKYGFDLKLALMLFMQWGLIALFFIDYDHKILPDIVIYILLWVNLVALTFNVSLNTMTISESVQGSVLGYMSIYITGYIYSAFRDRVGIGLGDCKLFALVGGLFGFNVLPAILFFACVLAIIFFVIRTVLNGISIKTEMCFGPFIIIPTLFGLYDIASINELFRIIILR